MRSGDTSAWCDVGQYRACFERKAGGLRFSIHGKPDLSQGFKQPVVVARGWIREGEAVQYQPGSAPLSEALERDLLVAARRLVMRSVE